MGHRHPGRERVGEDQLGLAGFREQALAGDLGLLVGVDRHQRTEDEDLREQIGARITLLAEGADPELAYPVGVGRLGRGHPGQRAQRSAARAIGVAAHRGLDPGEALVPTGGLPTGPGCDQHRRVEVQLQLCVGSAEVGAGIGEEVGRLLPPASLRQRPAELPRDPGALERVVGHAHRLAKAGDPSLVSVRQLGPAEIEQDALQQRR